MWADDLEIVESCGFDLSLSYSDSINSISVFAATDTFAHMKGPIMAFLFVKSFGTVTNSNRMMSKNHFRQKCEQMIYRDYPANCDIRKRCSFSTKNTI